MGAVSTTFCKNKIDTTVSKFVYFDASTANKQMFIQ
jgi:hypothetical protein